MMNGLRMQALRLLCIACCLTCGIGVSWMFPDRGFAHPHVFVDATVDFVFENGGLAGMKVHWTFDPMASSQYLTDLDINGDGTLTAEEWASQRDDIAVFLAEERFFLHVAVNGQSVFIPSIRDFVATFENGKLEYSFFAPLAAENGSDVIVAVFDPSYYTDFQIAEESFRFSGRSEGISYTLDDAPELAFYEGQIIPLAARVHF
ncbi:DUF1007 family protein [Desulfovibrio subterraneus]|uniref:DUF1007 family protein n=1 Tax=Desulfovibrio subterraneus TaxID=2718620 RepID=UPI0022B90949|nr:DUF1007 family protein [Desulfovibrio subterraneus]WBF65957.1 DUF1007 family protein [Desulfovibrio subterraneus]